MTMAKNQCDGCRQGLKLEGWIHKDADGHAWIGCTADRYSTVDISVNAAENLTRAGLVKAARGAKALNESE
jgi:hypothetical protein